MSKKISELPDGGAIQPADVLVVARSGSNFKITGTQVPDVAVVQSLVANVTSLQGLIANVGSNQNANVASLQANVTSLQASVASNKAALDTLAPLVNQNGTDIVSLKGSTSDLSAKIAALQASVGSGGSSGGGSTSNAFNQPHKAWRLRLDDSADHTNVSIALLDFGTSIDGGTAFGSPTVDPNGYPEQALDLYTSSVWIPNNVGGFPDYIGCIWPNPITVSQIVLATSSNNETMPTKFALEYSDDTTSGFDGTWTQATLWTTTPDWQSGDSRTFQNTGPASTGGSTNPGSGSGTTLSPSGVVAGTYNVQGVRSFSVDLYGRLTAVTDYARKAWRLRIDHTGSSPADAYCSLAELQFRTVAGTPQQATGGTPFSTTTGNGTAPYAAFNNDFGDRWVADYPSTPYPKYVGYIYATPVSVAEMMIEASGGYPSETPISGALEYSDDTTTGFDGTWATAMTFSTPATWGASEVRTFAVPAQGAGTDQSAQVAKLTANVAGLTSNVANLSAKVATLQTGGGPSSGGGSSSGATTELVAGVTTSVDGVSGSGHRTKGASATPVQDVVITGMSFLITAVAGVDYTASIWTMTGTTLVSQVYVSEAISPGAADPYTAKFSFPALTLNGGQTYALLLTASTGLLSSYYTSGPSIQSSVLPIRTMRGIRIDAVPTATAGLEDTGGPYMVNLYTTVGGGSASTGSTGSATRWDLKPPKAADFTDITSVSTAGPLMLSDDADEGLLISLVPVTGDRSSMILKPVPTSGDWSVTAKLIYDNNLPLSYGQQGLALFINGSTPCYFWGMDISRPYLTVNGYNPSGSYSGALYTAPTNIQSPMNPPKWFRIVYTAETNTYSFQISGQGKLFVPLYTATEGNLGGKVASVGIGFGVNQSPYTTGYLITTSVPYWSQSW